MPAIRLLTKSFVPPSTPSGAWQHGFGLDPTVTGQADTDGSGWLNDTQARAGERPKLETPAEAKRKGVALLHRGLLQDVI